MAVIVNASFDGTAGTNLTAYTGAEGKAWTNELGGFGGSAIVLSGVGTARANGSAGNVYTVAHGLATRNHWIRLGVQEMTDGGSVAIALRFSVSTINWISWMYQSSQNRCRAIIYSGGGLSASANYPVSLGTGLAGALWVNDKGSSIDFYWEADGVRTLLHTHGTDTYPTQYGIGIQTDPESVTPTASTRNHVESFQMWDSDPLVPPDAPTGLSVITL